MNSNKREFTEQEVEEFNHKWQQPLRTIFTKEDLAELVAAIESHNRAANPIS